MTQRTIRAKYLIETAQPLEKAALSMAGEQSCGTFLRVPGETNELREQFSANVDSIEEVGMVNHPSMEGAKIPKNGSSPEFKQALVELSWPFENVGVNLPNLISTVAGLVTSGVKDGYD